MPTIPIIEQRTRPVGVVGVNAAELAPVERSLAATAGGLRQLAQSADYREAAAHELALREGRVWANKAFTQAQAEWQRQLTARSEQAPLGAPEFTGTLLKDYDEYVAERLKAAPNRDAREYLELRFADYGTSLQQDAMRFEAGSRRALRTNQVGDAIDSARVVARARPEQYDATLADQLAAIDAAGLDAETADKLARVARESISAAAVESLVERDPAASLKALRSGPGESGQSAVEGLSPEARDRAINLAETEIRRREAEAKARAVEARQMLGDRLRDVAAAAQLGIPITNAPSRAELVAAFGPEEGAARFQGVQNLTKLAADVGALHQKPTAEILAEVEAYRPRQVEGAAEQTSLYNVAAQNAERVLKAREADPAGYLLQHSPLVAERWQAFQDGGEPGPYLSAVKAERERLQLPGHGVLPKGYVEAVADRISRPQGDETLAATMQAEADRWGPAWPEVYRQLATEAKLPDVALVIGSGMPKRAADTLAGVAKLPAKQQEAMLPAGTTRKDVADEVRDQLADLHGTFGVEGAATMAAVQTSVEQLALGYMAQGTAFGDAVERAARDVALDRYTFQDFRGHAYRVPEGVDADLVDEGATRFLRRFVLPSGTVATLPGLSEEELLGDATTAIRQDGYWRTAPDESGLRLYFGGRPVPGPVQLTWAELAQLSTEQEVPAGSLPRQAIERR